MKIAAIQSDITWEDPAANFARLAPEIARAARSGARLVVLPEMFACGFSMNVDKIAEPPDGPSARFLAEAAATHGIFVCGSLPERDPRRPRPHNTLLVAGPEGVLGRYQKIHPFTFANEHEHYEAGNSFLTLCLGDLRVSFFICYDLRFADEFWVRAPDTDAYVVIANWPERRRSHFTTLLRARAIENQAYVVGVNRVGLGSELTYVGDSCIVDPWGEVLTAAAKIEATIYAEVDPEVVRHARATFPVLRDRR